jgi:hypothetical protein
LRGKQKLIVCLLIINHLPLFHVSAKFAESPM